MVAHSKLYDLFHKECFVKEHLLPHFDTKTIQALRLVNTELSRMLTYPWRTDEVNIPTKSTRLTLLMNAIHCSRMKTIQKLLNAGADVNHTDVYGSTPLIRAVNCNQPHIVRLLLSRNQTRINKQGAVIPKSTPLMFAIARNYFEIVKILIDCHADMVSITNFDGNTSFMVACNQEPSESNTQIVDYMLYRMFSNMMLENMFVQNKHGDTCLHLALKKNNSHAARSIFWFLKNNHDDRYDYLMHVENKRRETPFKIMILMNQLELIKEFQRMFPIMVHSRSTKVSNTLLHYAVIHKKIEIAKFLLLQGADVNSQNIYGFTPLHFAVKEQDNQIVKLLCLASADVNICSVGDNTPLHFACRGKDTDIVKTLLQFNPDLNIRNLENQTPLEIAQLYGSSYCVRLMQDYSLIVLKQ